MEFGKFNFFFQCFLLLAFKQETNYLKSKKKLNKTLFSLSSMQSRWMGGSDDGTD